VLIALEVMTPFLAAVQIPYFIDGQRLLIGVAMDQPRPARLASTNSPSGHGQQLLGGESSAYRRCQPGR
jgi:hypothetical protein